ncbi:structural maintenance of chromosomes flexible hinge domain-containing protein GMI1-like isoform X2 [Humulus lupulus]|uniref:structural maintenance of chromosomes flexible hinge domain-containing protein GMI1-like isoform X2 n=1 Tax=Humulus lupulus TaxID=3486 RepID=UPI002B412CE0|nr:structural maintenance of chromosomes flexible hinge domain-containing protein GMI1-like isoform X2 [Humulus lupulus]
MEPETLYQKGKKRMLSEINDGGSNSIVKIYRFKILLPNGTTIGLNLRECGPKMPLDEFVSLVKDEYSRVVQRSKSMQCKRRINWNAGSLFLQDANDAKMTSIVDFKNFKPHKCHILILHDGSSKVAETFENMWDLTPDTDLLKEVPESYTFETALADLIDNSLQAVWSNSKNNQRLVSVDVLEDRISIFDTGIGMDGSDENSIAKWGKMGASLNRSEKEQAIGGKPPYLMPYFGMFGYGGAFASMHLGRHALVSSKTKGSKKVYTLRLEREALLSCSGSEFKWTTAGSLRDPLEDELARTRHGSFTKVEIFEPNIKTRDLLQLQCRLKDIYFPYIQCDELSNSGKTITPIKFQVNGTDLAEIEGGEVAITNLHSSNGPDFVLQVHFSFKQDSKTKSPGSRSYQEANARLKCAYFPVVKGKENIERILEKLKGEGHEVSEKYENFSRVAIRRLGRLIPDARWAWLPFMDLRHKKGSAAQILKRCCLRVKCFIDADAGINPTPSKTDLAHHSPFTTALRNFGNNLRENEKGIDVRVYRDGKLMSSSQLERDYQEWILQMHGQYDEEVDHGEDEPVLVLTPSPAKGKKIGISSDVSRLNKVIKRKEKTWEAGQKIKILKGACAGVHKNNVYATIEYFLFRGLQGDAGGDGQIVCRPLGTPDKDGCVLSEVDGMMSVNMNSSLSLPISVIDFEKCLPVENAEWNNQMDKLLQKFPSTIDLLSPKECEELEELPCTATAGKVPPKEVVAVVRPGNYVSKGDSRVLEQRYIFKSNIEMLLEVKFIGEEKDPQKHEHVLSKRVSPSSNHGVHGIYVFPLRCKLKHPHLFQKAGVYKFSFSLIDSSCERLVKSVKVKASSEIGKWAILRDKQSQSFSVSVGSTLRPFSIACYDIYGNRTPLRSNPEVVVQLQGNKDSVSHVKKIESGLSISEGKLKIQGLLIESSDLDKIRPDYEATLVISSSDHKFSVPIPCHVTPGCLQLVKAQQAILANQLLPGCIVKELELEMLDAYGNHVMEGSEVQVDVQGFQMLDHLGPRRKVDSDGCVDLSGLLKVTAGYGENVSFSVSSKNKVFFKQEFQIERRELRIASKVPEILTTGSILENIIFEIVNSEGIVDETIHHEEKTGLSHMLTIKADWLDMEESTRYTFKHGRCVVPAILLSKTEGTICFSAFHSRHSSLSVNVKVHMIKPAIPTPNLEHNKVSSTHALLLQDPSSINQVGVNYIMSIENKKKALEEKICKTGLAIQVVEEQCAKLNKKKEEVEQTIKELQDSTESHSLGFLNHLSTKEEVMEDIEKISNSAAAILCNISRVVPFQEPENHLMKDIIGVVALLGRVQYSQLSRILSEYLGVDQMLAVVTRSFESAAHLEMYTHTGEVDRSNALHAEAAILGKSINGRFTVMCLDNISPYRGGFEDHPQGKLALPLPCFIDGTIPKGFLGFAVNMIDLDEDQLSITNNSGNGLRETVFYRLLGQLQVYQTREDMLAASACIKHGAVSLDGGILKENGVMSFGFSDPGVCFQVVTTNNEMALSQENLKLLQDQKSELKTIDDKIKQNAKHHGQVLNYYEKTKKKLSKLMDDVERNL